MWKFSSLYWNLVLCAVNQFKVKDYFRNSYLHPSQWMNFKNKWNGNDTTRLFHLPPVEVEELPVTSTEENIDIVSATRIAR